MPQPTTFLVDPVPNEQAWPWAMPIYWTSSRTYAFNQQITSTVPDKALFYKSLDGGATWTQPDVAHALVCDGECDYFFDGLTKTINIVVAPKSFGVQSLQLINFDLDTETYSAQFGIVGAPSGTLTDLVRIERMSDGSLIVFYATSSGGGQATPLCAIFQSGAWGAPFAYTTNIGGIYAQLETVVPDPANNLVHVFYSDGAGTLAAFYRTIQSNGTLGAITTLPAGWNLHIGNLNHGKCFGSGILNAGVITVPVFTRDPITAIFSLNVVTVTIAGLVFALSLPIETALDATEGWEPAQAIAYVIGSTSHVIYFTGDGLGNFYNLVKYASNAGLGWSTTQLYDAMADPNAGENTGNSQWINAISGAPDPDGNPQFQIATWLTLNPDDGQDTATLSTKFTGAVSPVSLTCGNPPAGTVGSAYASSLVASGGTPPYTFAVIAGALPTGLSLDTATGVISGVPTLAGSFAYTVQVTDSLGATASAVCSIRILDITRYPSGGGSPFLCPPRGCEPLGTLKSCWGPVEISHEGPNFYAAYQSSAGEVFSFPLHPDYDPVEQIARAVAHIEKTHPSLNNPGAITYGLGRFYRFPSPASGRMALMRAIQQSLAPRRVL